METDLQAVYFDFGDSLFSYRNMPASMAAVIVEAAERHPQGLWHRFVARDINNKKMSSGGGQIRIQAQGP